MQEKNIIRVKKHNNKITYVKFCVECGKIFESQREHALACSVNCRQRIFRRKKAGKEFLFDVSQLETKKTTKKKAGI